MVAPLLIVILSLWSLTGLLMLGMCRSAARADDALEDMVRHERSVHWGRLDR